MKQEKIKEKIREYDCLVKKDTIKIFGGFYTEIVSTNRNQIPDEKMKLVIRECIADLEEGDRIKVIINRVE